MVERATGESFAGELRRRIFEPLGLETTWLAQYEPPRAPLAVTGYLGPLPFWPASEMFGELGPTTVLDQTNIEWGAGGVISAAEESLRFLAAVLESGDERIVSPVGRAAMQSFHPSIPLGRPPGTDLSGIEAGYGLGLVREVAPDFERLGHGGMFNGHAAGLFHFPRCDLSVALFVNRGFVQLLTMYDQLLPTLGCPPADVGPRAGEAAATPLE